MHQSNTLDVGMDVHQESMAVAYVANEYGAEVVSLGTIGTRPCDLDALIRTRHSKSQHLGFIVEAGPCGYWLACDLAKQGYVCWVVAPSRIPTKAGDRVNTDRRDTVSRTSVGRRRCDCVTGTANSGRVAHTPIQSWSPAPENGRPTGGPSPSRSP